MAQCNWTYRTDTGRQYVIGLFHGPNTGHVVVHCNSRIVLIDFHVLRDATYSFFIEDELCELKIEHRENRFHYGFEFNQKADTPKNQQRKALAKKHWRQTVLFFGTLLHSALLFVAGMKYWNSRQQESRHAVLLANHGNETVGRIAIDAGDPAALVVRYSFVANGRGYDAQKKSPEHAMPLENGDEFIVRYAPNYPSVNELVLDRPTSRQLQRYRERTTEKHARLHPEWHRSYVDCMVDIAYAQKGLAGYADLYFQDADPEDNPHHNRQTFHRLTRDLEFRDKVEERCR